jgi:hypothetical protein
MDVLLRRLAQISDEKGVEVTELLRVAAIKRQATRDLTPPPETSRRNSSISRRADEIPADGDLGNIGFDAAGLH